MHDCGLFVDGITSSGATGGRTTTPAATTGKTSSRGQTTPRRALGTLRSRAWTPSLGIEQNWIPTDPRTVLVKCESLQADPVPFDGTYQPCMTGGAGAGTIAPSATQGFAWPLAQLTDIPAAGMVPLPQYTATPTIATLALLSFSPSWTMTGLT
ncbi:hypothetical protein C8Q70DRAFT_1059371 [Cubamyces menziesii]|nr:hypothetical protein C8Q70DRAFT_1059371 [Cubamyces menziesii]